MALSELQKYLIVGLRIFGVEKDAILGIISAAETDDQLCEMMEWMCEHEGASTAEILKKTVELAQSVEHLYCFKRKE